MDCYVCCVFRVQCGEVNSRSRGQVASDESINKASQCRGAAMHRQAQVGKMGEDRGTGLHLGGTVPEAEESVGSTGFGPEVKVSILATREKPVQ